MSNLNCQLDGTWNHHGNQPLGISVRGYIDRLIAVGQHTLNVVLFYHCMGWKLGLNTMEKAWSCFLIAFSATCSHGLSSATPVLPSWTTSPGAISQNINPFLPYVVFVRNFVAARRRITTTPPETNKVNGASARDHRRWAERVCDRWITQRITILDG